VWSDGVGPLPARVPGTAAGALRDAGLWDPGDPRDFDAEEWCFSTRFTADPAEPDEEVLLRLDGVATVFDATLNGARIAEGSSMFRPEVVDVGGLLAGENELVIRCRPLRELLAEPRKPRARWRTRLVDDGNLRFFRTSLLGRAPGFAPGPAPVGPWRPVVLERKRRFSVDRLTVRAVLDEGAGVVSANALVRGIGGARPTEVELAVKGPSGSYGVAMTVEGDVASGRLRIEQPERWWPHTHGSPTLFAVSLRIDGVEVDAGNVGFRTLVSPADLEEEGVDLHLNGVPIFARGAVWTPLDLIGYSANDDDVRTAVEQARDAGMNILRVPGISVYESDALYDACDELGLLVWQDFMFANFDYPIADPAFRTTVVDEARGVLSRLAGRPSLAVICGNSEVEQQAAMMGADKGSGRGELFGDLLPALLSEAGTDGLYVPSTPTGGDLPFRLDHGVAHYFGVGAYRRPLEDARRAHVRFAAECLAFANVPDDDALPAALHDAERWKAGVPRDNGASWDFEDVRDHYLELLFGVDPDSLRRSDPRRYLELSRTVTGEVMAETLGEWRRGGSPTRGAIILWLRDVLPGTGWGLVDHRGEPKVVWHHVRRALAPVAVWTTDEGLGGVAVHIANDRDRELRANLRIALYRDFEHRLEEVAIPVELAAHTVTTKNIEALLGHFVDLAWAYRFGPARQDAVVVSLESPDEVHSQAVRFPAGRPLRRETVDALGLEARVEREAGRAEAVVVSARRLLYGVQIASPGFSSPDQSFFVEPGHVRRLALRPKSGEPPDPGSVTVTALNLDGEVSV
jgi:beta-mannosidase